MTSVSGTYTKDEGRAAWQAMEAQIRRAAGLQWWRQVLYAGAGWCVGLLVWKAIPWRSLFANSYGLNNPPLWLLHFADMAYEFLRPLAVGCLLFATIALLGLKTLGTRRSLRSANVIADDHAFPRPWSMTLTPEALISEDGDVKTIIRWPAVDAIYRCGKWWMVVKQGNPDFLDPRCFRDTEAEHLFISEALSYMTETARARSQKARNFIAGKAA